MSTPFVPYGPNPWQQLSWDWRAATNFMAGGAGGGLIVSALVADGPVAWLWFGAAIVALGLLAVWFEIGRPLRALNVFRHPHRSWMSREAMVAPLLFAAVASTAVVPPAASIAAGALAALLAFAFVYCQARIVHAARGIPAWRAPRVVPLLVATGLAEGAGLALLLQALAGPASLRLWAAAGLLLLGRLLLWEAWRRGLRTAAAALAAIDTAGLVFKATTIVPLGLAIVVLGAPLPTPVALLLQGVAGALALAGGLWFKFTLITRAGYNQGFALVHLPVRGAPRRQQS